jgi:hypothetical protein
MARLEVTPTSKFAVWQDGGALNKGNAKTTELRALPQCPITDLTSFVAAGELKDLGEYLAVQNLFDFNAVSDFTTVKEFPAAGRKHADAIELQDRGGYGDDETWPASFGFRECRGRRGSAEFWRHNANAAQLPVLVAFVDRLPFFESTGKVTIILSNAGDTGVEHCDHKFDDLVSEFVWLRTGVGPRKQFFVRDADGNKCYLKEKKIGDDDGACVWFDDHHSHSYDPIDEACYSIRIDGVFTDAFRKHICSVGVFHKQSVDGSTVGGLCAVLGAQRGAPLSVAAAMSSQNAIAKAHAAGDNKDDHVVVKALKDELEHARRRIVELEKILQEKDDLAESVPNVGDGTRPDIGPPRGLCEDSLFCARWAEATRPLYEIQMGTEHMAPLLYSIIRFTKPDKVLEVGAGFTTIFALQALRDNDEEVSMYQGLNRQSQEGSFAWPKLNWVNEGYLQRSGGYMHSQLHCVDNMAHTGTTARLVSTVADALGLEDRLRFTEGDALHEDTYEELLEEVGGEGRVGVLWLDFGDGDRLDEVLLDHGYWDLVDPNGGVVLIHSTLTNASSREWLKSMKKIAFESESSSGAPSPPTTDGDESAATNYSSRYGPFEMLSLMEPHKMRQNSVTMLRRKGQCAQEPYEEPIFTQYS